MTGFGAARFQDERLDASVEVRAVNNRFLKVVTKCPDVYAPLEGEIERLVREAIGRGTVSVAVRVDRLHRPEDFALNLVALKSYWSQLQGAARELHAPPPADLGHLLALPGVVCEGEPARSADLSADWQVIERTLRAALERLHAFRVEEGRTMVVELQASLGRISEELATVAQHAPETVAEYRQKLLERVRQALGEAGVSLRPDDVIREVSIYADRSDINEEITRMRAHLAQFESFLQEPVSPGRKLEFLSQEMHREVNTIGSKSGSARIARSVVEMKAAVERIREILQNVE
jgi:uncharacterized protein (TIGR00255 family)